MSDVVLYERRAAAFRITLNRPEKRNAINDALIAGVADGFRAAQADPDIRAIVLTGVGDKAFCAGGDLAPDGGFNFDLARPRAPYGDLLRLARDCPLPIVAEVNEHCMAGSMGLLGLADIGVAVEAAKFALPEVKVGLFPMQVMTLLMKLAPIRTLREWALTGEAFGAVEAREAGLVNHIVAAAELEARIGAIVSTLAARSPSALHRGKYALRALEDMSFDQAIAFAEGQLGLMTLTGDAREGLAAFNGRHAPDEPRLQAEGLANRMAEMAAIRIS
ncbi:MAG: enoyl-CoA hydratase [Rhizobiales bacterium 65-9]|nr:enoyl-CoA hydratase/isomerase family protein [Hyphomicrobiales bacterium]OJY35288.1 MAG: enoyl-CoA hydratase [Rhizobiales bacterium 65-9]